MTDNNKPPSKDGGDWLTEKARRDVIAAARKDARLSELPELVAYSTGYPLTSVALHMDGSGWLGVLKVDGPREPLATYVNAASYQDLLEMLLWMTKGATFYWRRDKYPPRGSSYRRA